MSLPMAGAAGHRPCGGVLVLGRIECTTGPHWRGINGLAESPPVHAGLCRRSNRGRTYRRYAALDGRPAGDAPPRRSTPEYDEVMAKRAQEAARPKTDQPK